MPARSGAQYLEGLRGPREVWFDGERVRDVTAHPILGRPARTLAELYDLQCAADQRERLTYPSPTTGQPVSLAFIQPRTVDDLVHRRVMFKTWADHHGGVLGRTPTISTPSSPASRPPARTSRRMVLSTVTRIVAYYELCRERDLCATHTFVDTASQPGADPG